MTPRQRFDDALSEMKKLQSEGFDIPGLSRLTMSATGKVKAAEPELPKRIPPEPAPAKRKPSAFHGFSQPATKEDKS